MSGWRDEELRSNSFEVQREEDWLNELIDSLMRSKDRRWQDFLEDRLHELHEIHRMNLEDVV